MRRIDTPAHAPKHGRHVIRVDDRSARMALQPRLPELYATLQDRITDFANDPDRCFLDESEGFPLRHEIGGEYYIGSELYQLSEDGEPLVWVRVRCLEKGTGSDYLELEALVTLLATGELRFDEFNTGVI